MFDAAAATAQGGRDHMEDFVWIERAFAGQRDSLYAAVFDGHGGDAVARRASEVLHARLAARIHAGHPLAAAIRSVFYEFDVVVSTELCGSTAALIVVRSAELTVANVGDSHVVLVSRDRAAVLTADHRLTNEAECRRVVAAGARISGPYACLPEGPGLMCTRSLGDGEFRRIGILADPEISSRTLAAGDEWILVGSDGVWDGLDPDAAGELARSAPTASRAAEGIRDAALAANTDNVSVIAVRLPDVRTF